MQATSRPALRWFAGSFGRGFRRCGEQPPDLTVSPRVAGYMHPVANAGRPKREPRPWRQASVSTPAASASSNSARGELRTEARSAGWSVPHCTTAPRARRRSPPASCARRGRPPLRPAAMGRAHHCASLRHGRAHASASAILQRRWPRPMPIVLAFCRTAASVRFMALATCGAGVRAFECALSARTSSFVQGTRARTFFLAINASPPSSIDPSLSRDRAGRRKPPRGSRHLSSGFVRRASGAILEANSSSLL